ncbi:MAG TPA: bifunctional RNase H/acid phosphatase [Nocardioides sp.]|uniref:bifunctional RNase H/acid phosphatase n=1 Tax=Nocardioides sp. TaxID=35761 RepID=UPI002F413E46
MAEIRRVIVEADGGSRGNPGRAAYGALVKDADTGRVLAEDGTAIGVASNNVAEYRGLIAGLTMAAEVAPDADIEVRMDSKLVVEQMSGNWKIKHPDMRPLAMEANRLATRRRGATTYTWVPREQNKHADRLANEALDGIRSGVTRHSGDEADSAVEVAESPAYRGWSPPGGPVTTLVLVRHGATALTAEKRFSGGLGSSNPGLTDEGRAQVREVADWLSPIGEAVDVVVTSPVRRTRESAEILAEHLGVGLVEEPGFAEMEFGTWDGMTFAEVRDQRPDEIEAWLGSLDAAPDGGESFREVEKRVLDALSRILEGHAGKTVVVVGHVTPIKVIVASAVDAPLSSLFRMELSTASVSVVSFFGDPGSDGIRGSMRLYNAQPPGAGQMLDPQRW